MKGHVSKSEENKRQSLTVTPLQKQVNGKSPVKFVDNRPEVVVQQKLEKIVNDIPNAKETAQIKSIVGNDSTPVQRAVDVFPEVRENDVVITAKGEVDEFKNGDSARDYGWNNVEKYKADAYIEKQKVASTNGYIDNTYLNAQAGHVLAEQNGGLGSDSDNVFAQDGGVNNAWYRSNFENPMRKALNGASSDENVLFRAVLWGGDIYKGKLEKESDDIERSDEDTDFDIDEVSSD